MTCCDQLKENFGESRRDQIQKNFDLMERLDLQF
jgi:hypothetical protein